jgi:hypothetical protein
LIIVKIFFRFGSCNGHSFAQNPLQLWLYGSLRGSQKLAAEAAQTLRLLIASFCLEPQRFGDIRSFHVHYNFNETQVLGT